MAALATVTFGALASTELAIESATIFIVTSRQSSFTFYLVRSDMIHFFTGAMAVMELEMQKVYSNISAKQYAHKQFKSFERRWFYWSNTWSLTYIHSLVILVGFYYKNTSLRGVSETCHPLLVNILCAEFLFLPNCLVPRSNFGESAFSNWIRFF